jgi:hypothetical protein
MIWKYFVFFLGHDNASAELHFENASKICIWNELLNNI